jgi:hypothetical protein
LVRATELTNLNVKLEKAKVRGLPCLFALAASVSDPALSHRQQFDRQDAASVADGKETHSLSKEGQA